MPALISVTFGPEMPAFGERRIAVEQSVLGVAWNVFVEVVGIVGVVIMYISFIRTSIYICTSLYCNSLRLLVCNSESF